MTDKTISGTLFDYRGSTDKSLTSERGKTDDSFAEQRQRTETKTDVTVKGNRRQADLDRHSSRDQTDTVTQLNRMSEASPNSQTTADRDSADLALKNQRLNDDAAVMAERDLMDEALVHEREILKAEVNKLLEDERNDTDQNLSRERVRTDEDALASSSLLSAEKTLHVATKAELTTRDEFLAIVSHDLRSPIGSILSYSDLALEEGDINPELRSWLEVIKRNAESSLRLIGDILDMERFAEGKLQMNFAPTDTDHFLSEVIATFHHAARSKNIQLKVVEGSRIGIAAIDSERLRQVLSNLIGNAMKFTPVGGAITVSTSRNNTELSVRVTDTGPGIPAEKRLKIFERYAQINNQDRRGLGLGLYIAAMFVEAHGGRIWVDSAGAVGSSFTFTIPLVSPPEGAHRHWV